MQANGDAFLKQQRKIQHVYAIAKTAITFLIVNVPLMLLIRQAFVKTHMYLLPLWLVFVYVSLTASALLGNFIILSHGRDLDKPVRHFLKALLRDSGAVTMYSSIVGAVLYGTLIGLQAMHVANLWRLLIIATILAWHSVLLMVIKRYQFRLRDYPKITSYAIVSQWRVTIKMIALSIGLVIVFYIFPTYLSIFIPVCFIGYFMAIVLKPVQKLIGDTFLINSGIVQNQGNL